MRAADGVAGLDAQLDFERREEGFEIRKAKGIGFLDDGGEPWIDQGGKHDRPDAVRLAARIDAPHRLARLVFAVDEGNAHRHETDGLELRQKTVAERLDGDGRAIRDEKNGALQGRHERGVGGQGGGEC
jgi:hypothetical protein